MSKKTEIPLDEELETLSENQATFILKTLVAAGHVSRALLDDAIALSRWVKP